MSTVDGSGGTVGGGAPGPGGSNMGGGGVGSGGGPGGNTNSGTLNSTVSNMGPTQTPTGDVQKIVETHFSQRHLYHQHEKQQEPLHATSLSTTPTTTKNSYSTTKLATYNSYSYLQKYNQNSNLSSNHPSTRNLYSHHLQNQPTHSPVNTTHLPMGDLVASVSQQTNFSNEPKLPLIKTSNIHPYSFDPVVAKSSHMKTTLDGNLVNTSSTSGSTLHIGGGGGCGVSGISTIMSTTGAMKMTTAGGAIATSIGGTPIALNVAQSSAAIRTIGAGGQSTQVRVVMPTNIIPLKQFDNTTGVGRTQITAIPAGVASATSRTVSNTSITVTRPVTQTTYFPRAGVTSTQMAAVGGGQRLVTPIRTGTNVGTMSAGGTVTGITTTGGFIRGTSATVSRNSSSPATSVISQATSTTWMQTNTGGQVQLIRAIPQQTQKRIITAQGMTSTAGAYSGINSSSVSGTVVANTPPMVVQTSGGSQTHNQQSAHGAQSTIQTVTSSGVSHNQAQSQQQQTYVATLSAVLPPRQHQATLVYSSNVAPTSQPPTQQLQQFNPTIASGQRLAVATQLSAAAASSGSTSRQIRPIPLPKSFSTAKLNTTSISIRAPNITSTLQPVGSVAGGGIGSGLGSGSVVASGNTAANNSPRSTTMTNLTTGVGSNVIPAANLSGTRIIQLQQQPGGAAQPLIGPTGRISGNVMFQPIIVNTSGAGKIVSGLRQPVTMTTKPSLTITPFGLGKLPSAAGGNSTQIGVNLAHQQSINTSSVQSSMGSGGGSSLSAIAVGGGGNSSPALTVSTSTSSVGVTNLSSAQLVNVSQAAGAAAAAGQMLTTQNIVSSAAAGNNTVLPLAIPTRGSTTGNILTGTITPLKNASTITVGKMMATVNNTGNLDSTSNVQGGGGSGGNIITSNAGAPTSVYIHQTASSQRIHGPNVNVNGTSLHAIPASSSGNTTVLTTTGNVAGISTPAGAFLPSGGTIYYESIPANSVQVSTGVLSLTTTTVTNSTLPSAQNQIANTQPPQSNVGISSLPFTVSATSHATGNSTATFTVVPSSGGRTIGQLQLPVSGAAGAQIQTVPLRFSAQLTSSTQHVSGSVSSSNTLTADAISVSQATQQLLQQSGQTLLIPSSVGASAHQVASVSTTTALTGAQGQHVVIPLQTSIKVTGGNAAGSTVMSNFLRKRDADGSPIRAAKNLGPTLLSMGNSSGSGGTIIANTAGSPASTSETSPFSITSVASSSASSSISSVQTTPSSLTTEALAKKDRAQAIPSCTVIGTQRMPRGESPVSSDGSTTVSANSSPGVEQQLQDGNIMMINHMPHGTNEATHFNPINEMYSNHHGNVNIHHSLLVSGGGGTPISSRNSSLDHHQQLHAPMVTNTARLNGGSLECSTRKKCRRSTNDSQLSAHSQGSLSLPPPSASGVAGSHMSSNNASNNSNYELATATANGGMLLAPVQGSMASGSTVSSLAHPYDSSNTSANALIANAAHNNTNSHKNNNLPPTASNKENAKPSEFTLRRPRNFSLLNNYKQSWKTANNHFQRYSDVKPREERRPTVIDLANQPNVLCKINGWKIHHLRSQMEDLCENESNGFDQLSNMLKQMETHEKNPEIERINELLKGNIQRSKIIVDGINEAQNQMMKIFEHKSHIADIISRCASKRNFKKREKF